MDKIPFTPPTLPPLNEEDIKNIKKINRKEFKNSYAYKKYIQPNRERRKKQKTDKRKKWWKDNWINISTLIVAVLTLIATILFGLIQLL